MQDDYKKGCTCPPGFRGDGVQSCEGINLVVLWYLANNKHKLESGSSWWSSAEWLDSRNIFSFFTFLLLIVLQILMSAKRKQPASVQVANAKTPGEVMSANAVVVCSTHEKMTRV